MMWGFQSMGVGAYRTDQMISKTNSIESKLATMWTSVTQGDIVGTWSLMRSPTSRIVGMNTAFATKFFYFAGFNQSRGVGPLILDARVVKGLQRVLPSSIAIPRRCQHLTMATADDYLWYLNMVQQIEQTYVPGTRHDVIEFWLWSLGAKET
jgi:hypothetical protein